MFMYIEKFCFLPFLAGFLLGLLFGPEDECDIILWDVGELPNNVVLKPRRLYSL
jgi:hypothetical protein